MFRDYFMIMNTTQYQGEQAQIINTFTTSFWCEACMHTRVIIASKVQNNILHVVDYMVGDDPYMKEKYMSYLLLVKNPGYENQYLMDTIDDGHIKNLHPELMAETFNMRSVL